MQKKVTLYKRVILLNKYRMPYSVAIVGLGAIGMGYDLDSPDVVHTHAKAFQTHNDFYLVAGIDYNIENRRTFELKYKCKSFTSINSALSEIQPDVFVIATNTNDHFDSFVKIVENFNPRLILC